MYQPHWTDVALPLLRLLQQELHISITATRALPVFQKDAFALLSKSFWVLTGKISVGKYVRNFHRCEGLSPRWTQKWGEKWAPATFLSFSLPSKKNDVWFHLRKSEVKSTSARHKSPRGGGGGSEFGITCYVAVWKETTEWDPRIGFKKRKWRL